MSAIDHANFLADSKYIPNHDEIFRQIISTGWAVKSNGDVDSPSGYFAVVEIPGDTGSLAEMRDAVEPHGEYRYLTNWPDPGWYVTLENELGQIFVYKTGSQITAMGEYYRLEADYERWMGESDER